MQELALVIPCFNEAARLDAGALRGLAAARPGLALWLVDDGSTDGTRAVLEALRASAPERFRLLPLARNGGKAEAVRAGLRAALADGAPIVGYLDADLSTPPEEALRLLDEAVRSRAAVVLGSRVRLLGRRIERRPHRHYLGRVFATIASVALRLPVYDTQCGAKVFRAGPALDHALSRPFRGRWTFDVELLGRLRDGGGGAPGLGEDDMVEVPLAAWRDVAGSRLRPGAMLVAGAQLLWLCARRRLRPAPRARAAGDRGGGAAARS